MFKTWKGEAIPRHPTMDDPKTKNVGRKSGGEGQNVG